MRSRNLLHLSKLDTFGEFMAERGYVRTPTRGEYELRRWRGPKGWIVLFAKQGATEHCTVPAAASRLVREFMRTSEADKGSKEG